MRRLQAFALVMATSLTFQAAAQEAPIDVTDSEIVKYKSVADSACREGGKKQGGAPAKVEAFCACLMSHLDRTMTHAEWQQVSFYSQKQRESDEKQVLAPHLKTFQGCHDKP
jgi:hypothetical protein